MIPPWFLVGEGGRGHPTTVLEDRINREPYFTHTIQAQISKLYCKQKLKVVGADEGKGRFQFP